MTKEGKPFFYRIVAADLLAEIIRIPEGQHREWLFKFGLDLVDGKGSTDYSKKVIAEVQEYRQQQAENAGKRWKDKKKRENRVALRAITEPDGSHMGRNGNSSSSSSNSNNSSTETETLKSKASVVQIKSARPPRKKKLSDEEMMQEIRTSEAYKGIDIDREKAKMELWCQRKNKIPTIARLINWLNNIEQPLLSQNQTKPKSYREQVNDAAVEGFLKGDY